MLHFEVINFSRFRSDFRFENQDIHHILTDYFSASIRGIACSGLSPVRYRMAGLGRAFAAACRHLRQRTKIKSHFFADMWDAVLFGDLRLDIGNSRIYAASPWHACSVFRIFFRVFRSGVQLHFQTTQLHNCAVCSTVCMGFFRICTFQHVLFGPSLGPAGAHPVSNSTNHSGCIF